MAKRLTLELVLNNMNKVHNNKYTYELYSWGNGITTTTKFNAICPIHGSFPVNYADHFRLKSGCPYCAGNKKKTTESFIQEAKVLHPAIDFSKVKYINQDTPVILICKKHGEYKQKPFNTLRTKWSCSDCARENGPKNKIINNISTKTEKLRTYFEKHPNFDRTKTFISEETTMFDDINIYCKEHGFFKATINNMITHDHSCKYCNKNQTKAETELQLLIEDSIKNDRSIISPLEIDILSKKHKFGIEYNGVVWHSYGRNSFRPLDNFGDLNKNKHLDKTVMMEAKGYQLFHIRDTHWENPIKKRIWISMLQSKMNKTIRIGARKTKVIDLSNHKQFVYSYLEENHLQGKIGFRYAYGLEYNGKIYAVMTFGKPRMNNNVEYELIRFCTFLGYTIQGGASKLLKEFERRHKPDSIVSYANRDWSQGNLYKTLGFSKIRITTPNFFYIKGTSKYNQISRINAQKKKLLVLLGDKYNPAKSATQNMIDSGYRIYYDTGNITYIKLRKNK